MKNKFFLVKTALILSFLPFLLHAQTDEKIYENPEVLAEYPDGQAAMFSFLSSKVEYPSQDSNKEIQTKVLMTFTVEKDGSLPDFKPRKRDNFTAVDSAVINVFQQMPKWTPAKQNGQVVRSKYTFTVVLCLKG